MKYALQNPNLGHEGVLSITPTMKRVRALTLAERSSSLGCMWIGAAGAGKTTTAEWLIADDFATPGRGIRLVAPNTGRARDPGFELGMAILMGVQGARLDPGMYRGRKSALLGLDLVHALDRARIGAVFLDESQYLCDRGLAALHAVIDSCNDSCRNPVFWVLIGSADLPDRVGRSPHLTRRVGEMVPFLAMEVEALSEFVADLFPHRIPAGSSPDEVASLLKAQSVSTPDEVVRMASRIAALREVLGSDYLDAANIRTAQGIRNANRKQAQRIRASGYRPMSTLGAS